MDATILQNMPMPTILSLVTKAADRLKDELKQDQTRLTAVYKRLLASKDKRKIEETRKKIGV